jgi:hypothetical protein
MNDDGVAFHFGAHDDGSAHADSGVSKRGLANRIATGRNTGPMSDDPNKKHIDSWFVSSQPHEIKTFKDAIKRETAAPDSLIDQAFTACCKEIAPSEGRAKLTACVIKKLNR